MCPVVSTRVLRPVPTLLGGSGRACASPPQRRDLPALLKRPVAATAPVGSSLAAPSGDGVGQAVSASASASKRAVWRASRSERVMD